MDKNGKIYNSILIFKVVVPTNEKKIADFFEMRIVCNEKNVADTNY